MGALLSLNDELSNLWHFLEVETARNSIEVGWSRLMADVVGAPQEQWGKLERYFLCSEHRCRESLLLREELAKIAEEYLFGKLDRDTVLQFGQHCQMTARFLVNQGQLSHWRSGEELEAECLPREAMGWYVCPLCYGGDLRLSLTGSGHECTECHENLQGPFGDRKGRYWLQKGDFSAKLPLILASEPS